MSGERIIERSALGHRVIIVGGTKAQVATLSKEISAPTVARMAGNLAKAVGRVVVAKARGEPVRVTPEVLAARTAACLACPAWDGAARGGLGKCRDKRCGCTGFKRELATEKCPRGYW